MLDNILNLKKWEGAVLKDSSDSDSSSEEEHVGPQKAGNLILPRLPFDHKALKNVISTHQIDVHYNQHHKKYVIKTQQLARGTRFADMTLDEVVRDADGELYTNAAQAWNHAFYWMSISPPGMDVSPKGDLFDAIKESGYGSVERLGERMIRMAQDLVGSGYVWLLKTPDGAPLLATTENADNPLKSQHRPILCLDVWEHAYYLDYESDRVGYLTKSVQLLLNWTFAYRNWDQKEGSK